MPGCAAIGCNNRSEKGYTMKCFPRDPTLRTIWKERVSRADWEPSNNSFLCHVHFEADQWTRSQSGRIRLKKNAVPSIFTITSTRKSPRKRKKFIQNSNIYIIEHLNSSLNNSELLTLQNTLCNQFIGSSEIKENKCAEICSVYKRGTTSTMNNSKEKNITVGFDENDDEVTKIMVDQDFQEVDASKIKVKTEIKSPLDTDQDLDDIERKLRLICDGESQTDEKYKLEGSRLENGKIAPRMGSVQKESSPTYLIGYNGQELLLKQETESKMNDRNNITAAVNRKRRSRHEIMKNIEKTVAGPSYFTNGTTQSFGKDTNPCLVTNAIKKSAFTIKITGIKEDVSEIMDGLDMERVVKYQSHDETDENDVVITSVLSVIDYSPNNSGIDNKLLVPKTEVVDSQKEEIEEDDQIPMEENANWRGNGNITILTDPSLNNDNSVIYELPRKKLKSQDDVIQKLTNELMAMKYRESGTHNINAEICDRGSNGKGTIGLLEKDRNAESKASVLSDLSTRVKQLDAANKGLTNILIEKNHQIKKLEWQIRKRDNSIKELNWKLDKASKYFERAEKRANTYRKKMVNMQNMIARRKLRELRLENAEIERHAINGKKSPPVLTEEQTNMSENITENYETETQYVVNESLIYRTVQDIFDESNDCDDDISIIDTREDFMRQFKDAI